MIGSAWMDAPIWAAAGRTMAHMLWLGVAVGLLGMVLRRMLRGHAPEIRHNVALGLLVMLGLAPAAIGPMVYEPGSVMASRPAVGAAEPGTGMPPPRRVAPSVVLSLAEPRSIQVSTVPYDWMDRALRLLPIAWAMGTSATLVLLSAGWIGVERLRRLSVPVESGPVMEMCNDLAATIGLTRRACVAVCDRLASPVLIGLVRPLILLPPSALSGWTPEELELVLLHELAHLRRHDHVVIVLQRGIEAFLFFQPAVWWLSSWLRLERELCCDRVVVTRTGRPRAYAEFLARLAGVPRPSLSLAFNDRSLSTRIARILNLEPPSRRTPRMRPTLPEGLGTLALVAALATIPLYATVRAQAPGAKAEGKTRPDVAKIREYLRTMASEVKLESATDAEVSDAVTALVKIADAQSRAEDRDAALQNLKKAERFLRERADKIDAPTLDEQSMNVARGFHTYGDDRLARETLRWKVQVMPARMAGLIPGGNPSPEQLAKFSPEERAKAVRTAEANRAAAECEVKGYASVYAIQWGDRASARTWLDETLEAAKRAPIEMRSEFLFYTAYGYSKLDDGAAVRRCLDELVRILPTIQDPATRKDCLTDLALVAALTDDPAESMKHFVGLDASIQERCLDILLRLGTMPSNRDAIWFDPARIKFGTGGEAFIIEDAAEFRKATARFSEWIAASKLDELARAKFVAKVAELKARAGDVAGAVAMANGLPDTLTRKAFPKAKRGHCDAIKPIALSAIAVHQSKAGDLAGARAGLDKAKAIVATIVTEDEKLVGTLAVVRGMMRSGLKDEAKAYLTEIRAFVESQSEPRRSRALLMTAEHQIELGDLAEAARLIERTREVDSLEREAGYMQLAAATRKAGDLPASREWTRRLIRHCEAQAKLPPPAKRPPLMIEGRGIGAETYISGDMEARAFHTPTWDVSAIVARAWVEEPAEVLKAIASLPAPRRHEAISSITCRAILDGDHEKAARYLAGAKGSGNAMMAYHSISYSLESLLETR